MRASVVHPDRCRGALARDTDHAGASASARSGAALGEGRRPATSLRPWRLRIRGERRRPAGGARSGRRGSRPADACALALEQDLKIRVCNGIFEFSPQEPLVHEDVDRRRQHPGPVLSLEKADSVYVLLSAKHELGFFLAQRRVFPDRHRDQQQNSHDVQRHEQDGHRVAVLLTP